MSCACAVELDAPPRAERARVDTANSRDLLERFRAGDPEATRAVYREFGRLVFAVAHRVLGSRELAEEATQETFVRAWRGAASFDVSREPGPWLATIARRTAIDVHRREARAFRVTVVDDDAVTSEPVRDLERADDVSAVRVAIDGLSEDERVVVQLHHLEGRTQAEVAEVLGIAVGTVKSRTFRARRNLARRLDHLRRPAGEAS